MHGFLVTIPAGGLGDFAGRAVIALALGGVIGLERQWRQRMAGLRTGRAAPGKPPKHHTRPMLAAAT